MSRTPKPNLLPLPVDAVLPDVLEALSSHGCAVLRAPTGSGKTTRVPPGLLGGGAVGKGRILVLEPRRLAARAAARRMAAENGWRLGEEVGYRVRFENRASAESRIVVMTEGILLQRLQRDPFLEGIGTVVFDEFHERNLASDLALAMCRRVRDDARPDLRLLAMSATLDPAPLQAFLGDCPAVEGTGRLHPVEIGYLRRPDDRPLHVAMAAAIRRELEASEGDLLAFLPGVGEIRRLADELEEVARQRGLRLAPLYGDLPPAEQDAALRAGERRRIVLATNVAETSVTVEGITGVVDSGWAREMRFDLACGLDRLERVRISRASADQRAGRAGRQGPGRCLRLWTAAEHAGLAALTRPEIARVDLAPGILQLRAWGESDLAAFGWFEAPLPAALDRGTTLLERLGAIDRQGVTPRGRELAGLPVHPRLGNLLLRGQALGIAPTAALAAALLSERSPFRRFDSRGDREAEPTSSDPLARLEAVEAFAEGRRSSGEWGRRLLPGAARFTLRARDQLLRLLKVGRLPQRPPEDRSDALAKALLAAFPDRVARRREEGGRQGVMVGGRGVRLLPESGVRNTPLFLCVELEAGRRGERSTAGVRQAVALEVSWLPESRRTVTEEARFDPHRQRVIASRIERYEDLPLSEIEVPAEPAAAEALLLEAAAANLRDALALDAPELASLLERLRFLTAARPDLDLPTFGDEDLIALLPSLVVGKRSFDELRKAPLAAILQGSLEHRHLRLLEEEAPEHLTVPSGSRIRLRYEAGKPPVLAVRIQELFGLPETPRLAGGRVPVLLHLLAPNSRPQQVTQDLSNFWATTYAEVRKELAGRYPKHAWPEDPLRAAPERRPRRRRRQG